MGIFAFRMNVQIDRKLQLGSPGCRTAKDIYSMLTFSMLIVDEGQLMSSTSPQTRILTVSNVITGIVYVHWMPCPCTL